MVRLVPVAAALAAGCLSTPPPAPIDDGLCGRDPRPARACDPAGAFPAAAWAPAQGFALRAALVDDVNADGALDLLLADNAPGAEGIWVLLGPIDPDAPRWHAFVPAGIAIGAVEVRQLVDAGSCPELTVFGRNTTGDRGVIQVWRYAGAPGMFDATPAVARAVDLAPDVAGGPVHAAWADARGAGLDLLYGDLYRLELLRAGGELDALATGAPVVVPHAVGEPGWMGVNGVAVAPTEDCARDDVLVTENREAHLLVRDGGDLAGGPALPMPDVLNLGSARVDLDGAPPLDVLVGGYDRLGAWLLAHDGDGGVVVTSAEGATLYEPAGPEFWIEGFAVGDLGGTPDPDVVLVDYDDPAGIAVLIDGLTASGGALTAARDHVYTLPVAGFVPRAVVIADLDREVPGAEAWVVATDGRLACLRRTPGLAELAPCR